VRIFRASVAPSVTGHFYDTRRSPEWANHAIGLTGGTNIGAIEFDGLGTPEDGVGNDSFMVGARLNFEGAHVENVGTVET
jgi:hypothetical protein